MPGEGSIYQRSDGRWVAALKLGPRENARKHVRYLPLRETKKGERYCRRATEKLLEELIADVRSGGRRRRVEPMTLGEFLRGWHEVYVHGVGHSQRVATASLMEHHVIPSMGAMRLSDVRASEVERALSAFRDRLSSQSVRHVYNLLAVALDAAVRDELIDRNPVRLVKPPVVTRIPRRPWSFDEANRFLDATRGDRYFAAYALSLAVPIRQGELLGLLWSRVDLETGRIVIAEQLQRRDGEYVRVTPKNRRETAKSIDEDVAQVLREHKARQDAERPIHPIDGDGLVFVTEQGRPVNGSWLTHHFEKLAAKAGVRVIPFHAMRNTATSFMAELDVHPKVAQEQGGWANISTPMERYTTTTTEQSRDAARRVTRKLRVAG